MKLNDFNQPRKKSPKALKEMHDCDQGREPDHEVNMARSDLYKLAKYAAKLHDMLQNVSEYQGLDGWQQAKITKAADYISAVYHSLDYDTKFDEAKEGGDLKDACWKGYKAVGLKDKDGRKVPNCVPEGLEEAGDPSWVGMSGEDYEDMMSRKGSWAPKRRGEPDDYDDDSNLSKAVQYEIQAEKERKAYEKKFKTEKDWQEGTAPNGGEYNLRYVVTSDNPDIIKNELRKFENSHDWYMRKLVDTEIQPGQGIGYYMDQNSWNVPVKPRKTTEDTNIQELNLGKTVKRSFTGSDLDSRIEQELNLADQAFRIGDLETGRHHFARYMRLIKLSQKNQAPQSLTDDIQVQEPVQEFLGLGKVASGISRFLGVGKGKKTAARPIDKDKKAAVKSRSVLAAQPTKRYATQVPPLKINVHTITTPEEWFERWNEVNKVQIQNPRMSTQIAKGALIRKATAMNQAAGREIIKVPGLSEGLIKDAALAVSLAAALYGGMELSSAKHTPLGKAMAAAAAAGDVEAAEDLKKLDFYIEADDADKIVSLSRKYLKGRK